jgi:hypothetical protein
MTQIKQLFQLTSKEVVAAVAEGLGWSLDLRRRFESVPVEVPDGAKLNEWDRERVLRCIEEDWTDMYLEESEKQRAADYLMQMQSVLYFDHYLSRPVYAKRFDCIMLPSHIVLGALWLQSRATPLWFTVAFKAAAEHAPRFTQLEFQPMQMQRFLRRCVVFTAHKLTSSSGQKCVNASKHVFMRVMIGFVGRLQVRR